MELTQTGSILIVEDDLASVRMMQLVLSKYGFTDITCAQDGAEAIKAMNARSDGFEVVIMDVNLPDMIGFDICKALKKAAPAPFSTLFVSGMEEREITEDAFACIGGPVQEVETLAKPFNPHVLVALAAFLLAATQAEPWRKPRLAG